MLKICTAYIYYFVLYIKCAVMVPTVFEGLSLGAMVCHFQGLESLRKMNSSPKVFER